MAAGTNEFLNLFLLHVCKLYLQPDLNSLNRGWLGLAKIDWAVFKVLTLYLSDTPSLVLDTFWKRSLLTVFYIIAPEGLSKKGDSLSLALFELSVSQSSVYKLMHEQARSGFPSWEHELLCHTVIWSHYSMRDLFIEIYKHDIMIRKCEVRLYTSFSCLYNDPLLAGPCYLVCFSFSYAF